MVQQAIQIPSEVADTMADALRACESLAEQERLEIKERLEKQRRAVEVGPRL
jgi:hypothetical protein